MGVVRISDEIKRRLEHLGGQDFSIDDVIRVLLQRTVPDESRMKEGQTQITVFDQLHGKPKYRKKGGAKVSYVCVECGAQYGDPELEPIPIVCSECVELDQDPESIDASIDGQEE